MTTSEADEDGARGADEGPSDLPNVPCRIFLPVVPAARVIGKGGASIRAIREQSGANVRVLQKELPQEMQRREDRVAVLTGEPYAVQEAIAAVLERVFDRSGLPDTADRAGRDRALIVEVLVPEKSGPHLIGQRGERIRTLIEETNCDLHVVKEPMSGLADQKRVRITANTVADAAAAVWRIQEVMGELVAGGVLKQDHFELRESFSGGNAGGQGSIFDGSFASRGPRSNASRDREVPVRLLVAQDEAAWIVGKRGNKITRLRDLAKVNMNDADSPPFDASERFVEISGGPLENRLRVVQMIVDDLELRQEASDELRILVPTELFGSVMGHRGDNIRNIIQSTGANLQQHKAEKGKDGNDYRFRLIEIRGDPSQRVEVVRQVYNSLENKNRDAAPGGQQLDFGLDSGFSGGLGEREVRPSMPGTNMSGLGLGLAGALAGAGAAGFGNFGASDRSAGAVAGDTSELGQLTLQLAMPSEEVAKLLANESSGIAWRAGVKLSAGRGPGGLVVLKVAGTAVGNSVACYLIQDRLFMMH